MSIVQLSRFLSFSLKRQLWYFIKSVSLCQELFYFSLFFAVLHKSALIYYHFCSHMSTIFYKFFHFFLGFHFTTTYGSFTRYYPQSYIKYTKTTGNFSSSFRIISNGERGIWTLAPVSRPTPLAGAPLQPLEYFSWFLFPLFRFNTFAVHKQLY